MEFLPKKMRDRIAGLSLGALRALDEWLHTLIAAAEERNQQILQQVKDELSRNGYTYRCEYIKCGKPGCKCVNSQGHGPYWYAYWNANGETHKKYIGKNFKPVKR